MCLLVAAGVLACAAIVPAVASAHGTHVKAKMSGDQVVGQAGAPNGTGTANLHLLRQKSKVRFKTKFSDIGGKAGLDIAVYSGKKGENGTLEFTLSTGKKNGVATGVPIKTLKRITRNPHKFHVTVKNDAYPTDGAIRGQLKAV
jgi:hypothetical protein